MLKRTISTILLWTLVLGCIGYLRVAGGVWLVTVVSVLTQHEFYQMLRRMGLRPFNRLGLTLGVLITLAPAYFPPPFSAEMVLGLAIVAFSVRILGERKPQNRVETLAWTLFGLLYVPFMLQFLVRIMQLGQHDGPPNEGLVLAVWLVAVSKGCDMGALLTGMACGRHKMAPGISPKKTWEGFVGGILFSATVGALIAHFWGQTMPASFTPLVAALAAIPIAALAVVSDLVESVIKRRADTKDSGATIPGIGGVFDLSDSLILAAPAGWLLFSLLQ